MAVSLFVGVRARSLSRSIATAAVAIAALALQPASATALNIDFNIGADTAPSTLGAAAGQVGVWNGLGGAPFSWSLVDLSGAAAPGVSLTVTGSGGYSGRGNLAPADVAPLLNDGIRMDTSPMVFVFSGLSGGSYSLYSYALNSSGLDDGAVVDVLGSADASQSIGGLWGGSFVQGVNYALHGITLGAGDDLTVSVTARQGASAARIAGFQLVQTGGTVPEPGTALLVALAAGTALVLRRRA